MYQRYGDPGFTLTPARGTPGDETIVAEVELRLKAQEIASQASRPEQDMALLRQHLDGLLKGARPEWLVSARTAAAVGRAYGALGEFEQAVTYYKSVILAERADGAIEAVEQLANLDARWAARLVQDKGTLPAAVSEKVERLFAEARQ